MIAVDAIASSMPERIPLLLLTLAFCVLLALFIGTAVGFLTRLDGKSWPRALLRGGTAFGGTLTLCIATLALAVPHLT